MLKYSKITVWSEGNFGVFKSPKRQPFSAQASKMDQIKKITALFFIR
jgi:hypothetical protein